jgi:putative ABC transport system permease protein
VLAAQALQTILFKVKPLDPFIYLVVAGLLTLVAAVSCFVPARRATRVNPMVALRTE